MFTIFYMVFIYRKWYGYGNIELEIIGEMTTLFIINVQYLLVFLFNQFVIYGLVLCSDLCGIFRLLFAFLFETKGF